MSAPPPGAGPPPVPPSDADRDWILSLLREHYALGHLDDAELDRRTGVVLAATDATEFGHAVSGLPPLAGAGGGQSVAAANWRSRHRHAQSSQPEAGWVPTAERFRDPASQQIVRVWVDPADGARHYVPEPPA